MGSGEANETASRPSNAQSSSLQSKATRYKMVGRSLAQGIYSAPKIDNGRLCVSRPCSRLASAGAKGTGRVRHEVRRRKEKARVCESCCWSLENWEVN